MQLAIGLRANNKQYTPATFVNAVLRMIAFSRGIEFHELLRHGEEVSAASVFANWQKTSTDPQTNLTPAKEWFLSHLPEASQLDLTSPIATLIALGLLISHQDSPLDWHIAVTAMSSAGLESGPHHP